MSDTEEFEKHHFEYGVGGECKRCKGYNSDEVHDVDGHVTVLN